MNSMTSVQSSFILGPSKMKTGKEKHGMRAPNKVILKRDKLCFSRLKQSCSNRLSDRQHVSSQPSLGRDQYRISPSPPRDASPIKSPERRAHIPKHIYNTLQKVENFRIKSSSITQAPTSASTSRLTSNPTTLQQREMSSTSSLIPKPSSLLQDPPYFPGNTSVTSQSIRSLFYNNQNTDAASKTARTAMNSSLRPSDVQAGLLKKFQETKPAFKNSGLQYTAQIYVMEPHSNIGKASHRRQSIEREIIVEDIEHLRETSQLGALSRKQKHLLRLRSSNSTVTLDPIPKEIRLQQPGKFSMVSAPSSPSLLKMKEDEFGEDNNHLLPVWLRPGRHSSERKEEIIEELSNPRPKKENASSQVSSEIDIQVEDAVIEKKEKKSPLPARKRSSTKTMLKSRKIPHSGMHSSKELKSIMELAKPEVKLSKNEPGTTKLTAKENAEFSVEPWRRDDSASSTASYLGQFLKKKSTLIKKDLQQHRRVSIRRARDSILNNFGQFNAAAPIPGDYKAENPYAWGFQRQNLIHPKRNVRLPQIVGKVSIFEDNIDRSPARNKLKISNNQIPPTGKAGPGSRNRKYQTSLKNNIGNEDIMNY